MLYRYLVFISIIVSGCAFAKNNNDYIKYKPTGLVVKLEDGVSKSQANKILHFFYKNYSVIQSNNKYYLKDYSFNNIRFIRKAIEPRDKRCNYFVGFGRFLDPKVETSEEGLDFCVNQEGEKFKVLDPINWG